MRTALLSGALLAFALSFDEIIVTNFTAGAGTQTLPMWIFSAIQRPNELPVVNVVALVLILLSRDPGLPGDPDQLRGRGRPDLRPSAERRRPRSPTSSRPTTASADDGDDRRHGPGLHACPRDTSAGLDAGIDDGGPLRECPVADRRADCAGRRSPGGHPAAYRAAA